MRSLPVPKAMTTFPLLPLTEADGLPPCDDLAATGQPMKSQSSCQGCGVAPAQSIQHWQLWPLSSL